MLGSLEFTVNLGAAMIACSPSSGKKDPPWGSLDRKSVGPVSSRFTMGLCGEKEVEIHLRRHWTMTSSLYTQTQKTWLHTHMCIYLSTQVCAQIHSTLWKWLTHQTVSFLRVKKKSVDYHLNILIYNYQDIHIWCQYEL